MNSSVPFGESWCKLPFKKTDFIYFDGLASRILTHTCTLIFLLGVKLFTCQYISCVFKTLFVPKPELGGRLQSPRLKDQHPCTEPGDVPVIPFLKQPGDSNSTFTGITEKCE